jgi:hypothetical protein
MRRSTLMTGLGGIAVVAVVATMLTQCGKNGPSSSPPPSGSIRALVAGAQTLTLVNNGNSDSPLRVGKGYFGFALITGEGQLITGGSPQVWVARDETTRALGPFPATWFAFTAYEKTHDTSPRSDLAGTYATTIDFPSPGNWNVAVTISDGSKKFAGAGAVPVTTGKVVAQVGTRAISLKTPVAKTVAGRQQICTRKPPDPMHYISLDRALRNHKPTVVTFATPLLCESMLCGPVVDEQLLAFEKIGAAKANFIHVEEFLPGKDLQPPPATADNASPAFKAWGFQTEPWTIVIDTHGIIQARFEGPVTAPQIEAALAPLL